MKGVDLLRVSFLSVMTVLSSILLGIDIKGHVKDSTNGELLIGAHLLLSSENDTKYSAVSGLDGSYLITVATPGNYSLIVSYLGYEIERSQINITPETETLNHTIYLLPLDNTLGIVQIRADIKGTDYDARKIEREAATVVNVISAKQIELSPDITVANVIQRVSGLSIERNSSGDPQYAIIRGMDKRYNNTLINGIKIPSPDNENRFVPLDIFPAVFLERLEVHKSLLPHMEADAIGGSVNMVMKSASSRKTVNADFQTGYNSLHTQRPFGTYDRSGVQKRSPKERHGANYRATPSDFPVENMELLNRTALPDIIANLTYSNRFLDKKLGIMLGGSFQNSYRPVSNYFYDPSVDNKEGNPQIMRQLIRRETSSQMQRVAIHAKADYTLNARNRFSVYVGQYNLNEFRVRDQIRQESFVAVNNYAVYPITRFSNIYQSITTLDLRGNHQLSDKLLFKWVAVLSRAKNDRPDDGVFSRAGQMNSQTGEITNEIVYFQGTRNSRAWERNTDNDLSVYTDFRYQPVGIFKESEFFGGLMFRNKVRDNYYNYYNYAQIFGQFRGVDWDDFGDVKFTAMANPLGSGDRSNLVYDAYERIGAAYLSMHTSYRKIEIKGGFRAEHTIQGYVINALSASSNNTELEKKQVYTHLFPSIALKRKLGAKSFLKTTYFKGISRPGFYEIVPTIRNNGGGDAFYNERGNSDLKPSIGHSVDVRYEYFPDHKGQFLLGAFFKRILDPIEYGFPKIVEGQSPITSQLLPQNFDNANNFGVEADYTHYFNRFGLRLTYTYTNSEITTNKIVLNPDGSAQLVEQTRPLQGQSDHVGNLSLLWKDQKNLFDVQLVMNYTGERIAFVSPFFQADHYMRPMTQLDLSIEKGNKKGWVVFVKVNNILNTPYQIYVKKPLAVPTDPYPYQNDPYSIGNVRRDLYGISFRLGIRYNLEMAKHYKSTKNQKK